MRCAVEFNIFVHKKKYRVLFINGNYCSFLRIRSQLPNDRLKSDSWFHPSTNDKTEIVFFSIKHVLTRSNWMRAGKKRAVICWASERWTSRWVIWTRVWQTATSAIQNSSPVRTRQPDRPPPVHQPVKFNRRSPGAGTRRTCGTFCPRAGRSENCRRTQWGRHRRQPWQSSTRRRSRRRPCSSPRRRPPNRCTRTSTQRRCTRPGHTTGP